MAGSREEAAYKALPSCTAGSVANLHISVKQWQARNTSTKQPLSFQCMSNEVLPQEGKWWKTPQRREETLSQTSCLTLNLRTSLPKSLNEETLRKTN